MAEIFNGSFVQIIHKAATGLNCFYNETSCFLSHAHYSDQVSSLASIFYKSSLDYDYLHRDSWRWKAVNIGILAGTIFAEFYLAKVCSLLTVAFSLKTIGVLTGMALSVFLSVQAILSFFPFNPSYKHLKRVIDLDSGGKNILDSSTVSYLKSYNFFLMLEKLDNLGISYVFVQGASERLDGQVLEVDCAEVEKEEDLSKRFILFVIKVSGKGAAPIVGNLDDFISPVKTNKEIKHFVLQIKEYNSKFHPMHDYGLKNLEKEIEDFRKGLSPIG